MTSLCLRYPKLTTLCAIGWLAWVIFFVVSVFPADSGYNPVVLKCNSAQLVARTPGYLVLSQGSHRFHFPWSSKLMKSSWNEQYHICTGANETVVTVFIPTAI